MLPNKQKWPHLRYLFRVQVYMLSWVISPLLVSQDFSWENKLNKKNNHLYLKYFLTLLSFSLWASCSKINYLNEHSSLHLILLIFVLNHIIYDKIWKTKVQITVVFFIGEQESDSVCCLYSFCTFVLLMLLALSFDGAKTKK